MTTADAIDLNDSAQILLADHPIANLIVFGGLRAEGGYSVPAFEFVQTLKSLSLNVLFVKDTTRRWYNFGLKGFSESMDDTTVQIQKVVDEYFPADLPLVTLGNSMGGYASIFFGEMLSAQYVLSIVPQTIISTEARLRLGDPRWSADFARFHPSRADLRHSLRGRATKIQVVVGRKCIPDVIQAANIAGARGVFIDVIDGAEHNVTKLWKESGSLTSTIQSYIEDGIGLKDYQKSYAGRR